MMWLWSLAIGCAPAEPAVPDPLRCVEFADVNTVSLRECCYEAGASDCQQGFLPMQALHGPEQTPLQEDNEIFYTVCQKHTSPAYDEYCKGYCNACTEYEGDHMMAMWWSGSEDPEVQAVSQERDCYCLNYR